MTNNMNNFLVRTEKIYVTPFMLKINYNFLNLKNVPYKSFEYYMGTLINVELGASNNVTQHLIKGDDIPEVFITFVLTKNKKLGFLHEKFVYNKLKTPTNVLSQYNDFISEKYLELLKAFWHSKFSSADIEYVTKFTLHITIQK